jgi:Protein of unknown function (DUF3891)
MFRSRRRPVLFPQAEHARLAGMIALAWGNDRFARPTLPFDSFVSGVTLHDRGYAQFDADGIGEVTADRWNAIQRASFTPRGEDPVVDLVVALHVHRLVSRSEHAGLAAMTAALPELHHAAAVDESDAAEANRVTDLCDRIAFDFCVEEPTSGRVAVAPARGADPVTVGYAVDGNGEITLDPWPLGSPSVSGIILGFRAEGYPDRLEPVVVSFHGRPGRIHSSF